MFDFISYINRMETVPLEDTSLEQAGSNSSEYSEILKHHIKYTKLLGSYVNGAKANLIIKCTTKVVFFIITMGIWITMVWMFKDSFDTAIGLIKDRKGYSAGMYRQS